MKAISHSNDQTENTVRRPGSRDFASCISTLTDEIRLAIQWNRPSILLVINPSLQSREKAQNALRSSLSTLTTRIVPIGPRHATIDLFEFLAQPEPHENCIYFVEGLSRIDDSYRALNLRREQIVEQRLIVLFWLTQQEAKELPIAAPDFWAFRHRVIEFRSQRGSRRQALPSGLMVWHANDPFLRSEVSRGETISQEELLRALPVRAESLFIRAGAAYRLASLYWLQGEITRASSLLAEHMEECKTSDLSELLAMFLNGQAIISYDQGAPRESAAKLELALQMRPADPVLACNLAIAVFAIGRTGQSIKLLDRAVRSSSSCAWLWYVLGQIQLACGKLEDADASFQAAVQLDPAPACPRYARMVCRVRMGDNAQDAVTTYFPEYDRSTGHHHTLYVGTLLDEPVLALNRLQTALTNGTLSLTFLKRDPIFHILLPETTRETLFAS